MFADPAGTPDLRQAVLEWLNVADKYTIDNVVVSTGANQSLLNISLAICKPADAVFVNKIVLGEEEPSSPYGSLSAKLQLLQ